MSKRSSNQKGFSPVEILLVLILIVLVGGVGYYVYHSQNTANNTLNSASIVTNSAAANKPTTGDAVNRAKVAYTLYAKAASGKQLAAVKSYVTSDLYTKLSAAAGGTTDPLLCSATTPKTVTAALDTSATTKTDAAVTVTETNNDGSTVKPTVTVDLSTLKISAISCPTS